MANISIPNGIRETILRCLALCLALWGKKKKTQRSEREDLLPQAAHDKQLYSQPALERDLPEV